MFRRYDLQVLRIALSAQAQVVVRIAPPARRLLSTMALRPHPGWVWTLAAIIVGMARRYVWTPGYLGSATKTPCLLGPQHTGHHRRGGYVFIAGHWR